MVNKYSY